jgi:hypothetical protein
MMNFWMLLEDLAGEIATVFDGKGGWDNQPIDGKGGWDRTDGKAGW